MDEFCSIEKQLNPKVVEYIKGEILPRYDSNIGGHGRDHIKSVIMRSFEIMNEFHLEVDPNMVYVIAAFHDISYKINPDEHEEYSAREFFQDKKMKEFFTDEQREVMREAIIDHRASLEYEARSIYGKLVSSADREISVSNMLNRSFLYQKDKHASENPSVRQIIDYSYKKLSSKYGKGGYAKMYYPDQKYKDYLQEMQTLLDNKDLFVEREMKLAKGMNLLQEEGR